MNMTCGTRQGYARGCRCSACTEANTFACSDAKADRIAALKSGAKQPRAHNASTYTNWGCRCDVCVTAHFKLMKDRTHLISDDRHGTLTNYSYGCRCADCREASASYHKARRERSLS